MAFIAVPAVAAGVGYLLGGAATFLGASYAAWGWLAGSILYSAVHRTKLQPSYGPRLADLKIQVSSYGTMLAIVQGTCRVAGNVIWGQPIEEHTETTTARNKGGGSTQEVVQYWYSATFAVAVCEGPAIAVRKVWANGALIFDRGIDTNPNVFLASRDMTILLGDEDQEPAALIEGYEGAGNVPGYRGTVLALFDTMALGTFGNRIPNLEFEVVRSGTLVTLVPQEWVTLPEGESFYDSGLGDPYRVAQVVPDSSRVWMVLDVTGNPRRLALFNAFSEVYDVVLDFDGDIYLQGVDENGYAWVAQEGGTEEGLHHISTVGGDDYNVGSDSFNRYVEIAEAGDILVLHVNEALGAHSIWTIDPDVTPVAKSQVTTGKFINYLFAKAGAVSGRVYVAGYDTNAVTPAAARIGYVDEDGVWTTLVDYNHVGSAAYGIVGQSYLFVRSGNTGEADVIEKRTHAGALVDSIALSGLTGTDYAAVFQFSLDAAEAYLYVKAGARIYKVSTGTMEESLANASAGSTNEQFIQGSAFQGAGTIVTQIGTDDTILKIVPPDQLVDVAPPTLEDAAEAIITHSPNPYDGADLSLSDLAGVDVQGYVITQPITKREALEQLQPAYFYRLIESDYQIKGKLMSTVSSLVSIPEAHLGARERRDEIVDPLRIARIKEDDLPRRVHVSYISRDNDYQVGKQSSKRIATQSQQEITISLPIVLTDEQAAQLAEAAMYEAWSLRESVELTTSRRYTLYEPMDVLTATMGDLSIVLRAMEKHEGANGLTRWKAIPAYAEAYTQVAPGSDTGTGQTITPLAPTEAIPLDIHLLRQIDDYPGEYWAARGLSDAWSGAKLYQSRDEGVTYESIPNGLLAAAAGIGALTASMNGPPNDRYEAFDWSNVVEVRMRPGVELSSYTEAQIFAGTATPLLIKRPGEPGGEILYYRDAVNTAPQIWEVSGLLRARGGTETFVEHDAGELVVVLDAALLSVMQSAVDVNRELIYKAPSIGSTLANASPIPFTNTNVRAKPLAPVHLGGGINGSDDIVIHWTRRTRYPTSITEDSVIEPLGEVFERYVVEVLDGDDVIRTEGDDGSITSPTFTYTAAMQVEDFGAERPTVYVRVYQLSDTYGRGYPVDGWVPAVAADAYEYYRFSVIDTPVGTKLLVSEVQLIADDGVTNVAAGIVPTSNLAFSDGGFGFTAAKMTDSNLNTDSLIDPASTPTMLTCVITFRLAYPVALAGWKQGGCSSGIGTTNAYFRGCTLSGANRDDDADTTVGTFAGLTFPGGSTLSSLYPI